MPRFIGIADGVADRISAQYFASTAKGHFRYLTQVDTDSTFFLCILALKKVLLECVADSVADGNTLWCGGSNQWAELSLVIHPIRLGVGVPRGVGPNVVRTVGPN